MKAHTSTPPSHATYANSRFSTLCLPLNSRTYSKFFWELPQFAIRINFYKFLFPRFFTVEKDIIFITQFVRHMVKVVDCE